MTQQERETLLANALEPIHRGANWFYWIVGLSLVNVGLAVAEADRHFLVGVAMAEIATGLITEVDASTTYQVIGGVLIFIILGAFLLIGRKAHKPSKIAFIIGMVLYGLDGIIYLAFSDFLSAAFHGYVIYNFWTGYKAIDDYLLIYNHEVTEAEQIEVAEVTESVVLEPAGVIIETEDPYKPVITLRFVY